MEEKHLPEQDPPFPEERLTAPEPEAIEVPLIETLRFTSEVTGEALEDDMPSPEPEDAPAPAEESPEVEPVQSDTPAEMLEDLSEPSHLSLPAEESESLPEETKPQLEPFATPEPEEISVSEVSVQESSPVVTDDMDAVSEKSSQQEQPTPETKESPFDLSVLDDPELDAILSEETQPEPDVPFREDGGDFEEMLHAAPPQEPSPTPTREPQKGRPKRKKGEGLLGIPNILVTVVWLSLILAIGVTAGRMLWVCAADVLAFGREDRSVTITIYESDSMDDIIEKLYNNGLIRYRSLFRLYANISDAEEDIDPGIYDLNARYDYHALVNMMSASSSRTVVEDVLIPEGYSCRQIFALLEEKRICTAVDLAAYAASGELKDYWFLEDVERGQEYCLEGYLFPDTYDFYKNSSPREVLEKLLDNFDHRFDEEMRGQIETLNANVTRGTFTVRDVTIVASMIEKEAAAPVEAPNIAGVIYNRLFKWSDNPPYLNIDASIVYALGGKSELTREDLKIDSPYNTYTNTGLTPTPISNPGLSSLKAALSPASHNYYYYVLNPETGMHTFSTTYEEHSGYVAAYAEGR